MAIAQTANVEAPVDKPNAIDAALLPSAKDASLQVAPATLPEHTQCSRLNAEDWRGPLTLEQYMKREKHLMAQDLTKSGKEIGWILTSTSLPKDDQGHRPILASCETIPSQAYVAKDGSLTKTLVHGLGSVFTRPEHRGKSYASRMMKELGQTLQTCQQPNGDRSLFTVLYSDIGREFYSRLGWKAFPSTHIRLSPLKFATYNEMKQSLPAVQELRSSDLSTIPTTEYVQEALLASSRSTPGVSHVAIAPDVAHFKWHHAREEFVSKALGHSISEHKGVVHAESGVALIWSRTFAADKNAYTLHVLHVAVPPQLSDRESLRNIIAALLLRAQYEASLAGMSAGVEVWDPSEDILAAAQTLRQDKGDTVEVVHRDTDHICSLRWTGPEPAGHSVVWHFRQKYAWC